MDNMCYAGLSTQRLDYLKNYELKKKPFYNGHNYTYNDNTLQDILYHCGDSSKNSNVTTNASDEFLGSYRRKGNRYGEGVAGLESDIINDMNMRNRRNKIGINQNSTDIKNILQNSYSDNYLSIGSTINNENENNNNNNKLSINKNIGSVTSLLSDKGHVMPPKKTLTRHIDDTEIGKYFSTKYAVTDKSTGRTEIMVQRKPGSSNVIVQNFSAFDAYATFRAENKRNSRPDSFVHTKMGIVPIEGAEREERRNKGNAIFTHQHRRDNIAPENYWLCPTVESEQKKHNGNC